MKYRRRYTYVPQGPYCSHDWTVIGRDGAIQFHVTDLGEKSEERYSAGLEIHSRRPLADRAPTDERCWLIGGPCWHDGTSMYARERIVPFWLQSPHDHERMFAFLQREYAERFGQ